MSDLASEGARVFVVGSFVVACCAKVPRIPKTGQTLAAAAFTAEAGGKGFNLALGTRRLGAEVDGAFAVGRDIFADFAEQSFRRAGLPLGMLVRYETNTACGIGMTDLAGENCIAVHSGANACLSAADVEARAPAIAAADIVLAQFEVPDEPIRAAFALARAAGRPTLLNPSPCRALEPGLLGLTTILVMNESEARQLAGLGAPADAWDLDGPDGTAPVDHAALAAGLLERGPELVVITLGEKGALAFARQAAPTYQPAFRIEVHDTIGCGDAFSAGLAMALVQGHGLPESLRRAAACGAIVAGRFGVFDALPDGCEVDAVLTRPETSGAGRSLQEPELQAT